jgi:release factor glutamine methyltransferase
MNSKTLLDQIVAQIALMETSEEVRAIAFLILKNKFDLSQSDELTDKKIELTDSQLKELNQIIKRINSNEPIQYILGSVDFFDRKFIVDKRVLIPRPETEELVRAIINHHHLHPPHAKPYRDYGFDGKKHLTTFRILDIGTGSGCIPITLKLEIPDSEVFATDISDRAIQVANANVETLGANISISKHDILKEPIEHEELDVLVSNPPYIMESEMDSLKKNVIDFEPHSALFVPADDPLLFYRAICEKGFRALKANGRLYVEVNEKLAKGVANLFTSFGFRDVTIMKDVSNKDRIVTATK